MTILDFNQPSMFAVLKKFSDGLPKKSLCSKLLVNALSEVLSTGFMKDMFLKHKAISFHLNNLDIDKIKKIAKKDKKKISPAKRLIRYMEILTDEKEKIDLKKNLAIKESVRFLLENDKAISKLMEYTEKPLSYYDDNKYYQIFLKRMKELTASIKDECAKFLQENNLDINNIDYKEPDFEAIEKKDYTIEIAEIMTMIEKNPGAMHEIIKKNSTTILESMYKDRILNKDQYIDMDITIKVANKADKLDELTIFARLASMQIKHKKSLENEFIEETRQSPVVLRKGLTESMSALKGISTNNTQDNVKETLQEFIELKNEVNAMKIEDKQEFTSRLSNS